MSIKPQVHAITTMFCSATLHQQSDRSLRIDKIPLGCGDFGPIVAELVGADHTEDSTLITRLIAGEHKAGRSDCYGSLIRVLRLGLRGGAAVKGQTKKHQGSFFRRGLDFQDGANLRVERANDLRPQAR